MYINESLFWEQWRATHNCIIQSLYWTSHKKKKKEVGFTRIILTAGLFKTFSSLSNSKYSSSDNFMPPTPTELKDIHHINKTTIAVVGAMADVAVYQKNKYVDEVLVSPCLAWRTQSMGLIDVVNSLAQWN